VPQVQKFWDLTLFEIAFYLLYHFLSFFGQNSLPPESREEVSSRYTFPLRSTIPLFSLKLPLIGPARAPVRSCTLLCICHSIVCRNNCFLRLSGARPGRSARGGIDLARFCAVGISVLQESCKSCFFCPFQETSALKVVIL